MTYAQKFVSENVVVDYDHTGTARRAYIMLRNCNSCDAADPCKLLVPGVIRKYKWAPDLKMLSFECRVRFVRALEVIEDDNLARMFIILNQMFSSDSIKRFFNDVWLAHNNVTARKANKTEFCRINRLKKLGVIKDDPDHREIVRTTSNMSIREAAERSRNF